MVNSIAIQLKLEMNIGIIPVHNNLQDCYFACLQARGTPTFQTTFNYVYAAMSIQDMIKLGQNEIKGTDDVIKRSAKIVEETIQAATDTAVTLDGQTKQMEHVLDSLDNIQFSLQKAKQVIRDITRGIATDK